ncbi:MAG: acetyl-CoA acetyltransferase [Dehalococcoidia bacterium]|nr:MAG: acetyl-CoA acetyltransferase [Dehalococcoidia bacterium]
MPGIKDRVAIVGMGCTRFGELWDKSDQDMMVEACHEALDDAGIDLKEIQAAWLGIQGAETGCSGARLARALKTDYIPVTRVENYCATGIEAFRGAAYAVAAGIYDIALACGAEKLKDSGATGLTQMGGEPQFGSWVWAPIVAPARFALSATRYFHTYGLSPQEGKEMLARIAVKNHHNGSLNQRAHFQREITLEQAINAPMIAWPLGLYDCCGVSDGSAAAIITTPEIAKRIRDDYVMVKAFSISCGAGPQGVIADDYDYVHVDEIVRSGQMAYEEAGIKNPRKEVDIAEIHDCFTITEVLICEDLGFTPRGKYKEDIEAGTFDLGGEVAVNADGGLKCFGHPVGASGIRMIFESYLQLQGKAGPRQLQNMRIGLAQNYGGLPGGGVSGVAIVGARD